MAKARQSEDIENRDTEDQLPQEVPVQYPQEPIPMPGRPMPHAAEPGLSPITAVSEELAPVISSSVFDAMSALQEARTYLRSKLRRVPTIAELAAASALTPFQIEAFLALESIAWGIQSDSGRLLRFTRPREARRELIPTISSSIFDAISTLQKVRTDLKQKFQRPPSISEMAAESRLKPFEIEAFLALESISHRGVQSNGRVLTFMRESDEARLVRERDDKKTKAGDTTVRQDEAGGVETKKSTARIPVSQPQHLALEVLEELTELAAPSTQPREILKLEEAMTSMRELLSVTRGMPPEQRSKFVSLVNTIVDRHNYCFELQPDKAVARKLYFNSDSSKGGDILFRVTDGTTRGFLKTQFALIPYIRSYRKSR